ncbi:hypothetical protein COV58_00665 [Candidatus Roizmanbacteria bacterium CG11_big_fil_rev_8_21_14_0_20_36_8]|uniref:Uncharacterized protein n=2 Tax=Candidatus Roizmaniibacteriota TaxID=1752723 RepID=A0A2M6IV26_9BACT|nr:MAG: hypothetical protein COV58_00665 [Candidatus Roizmanbacteria bacterium CG11_big_fil_rev_8_21_14_0_20_36_8]PIZ65606.1 MAG: hypothetical protein COY14_01980 [Candidatus Roizmanbacteria bacterium CG_4_10_14_0_2_um_filter_36_9]
MKNSKQIDVVDKIHNFQKKVLSMIPPSKEIEHDVRMMNFKIKPLMGTITNLDFGNSEFVLTLWRLGKLDEFFRKELRGMNNKQKDVFFRMVNDLRRNLQNELRRINISEQNPKKVPLAFEIEIVKDANFKVN